MTHCVSRAMADDSKVSSKCYAGSTCSTRRTILMRKYQVSSMNTAVTELVLTRTTCLTVNYDIHVVHTGSLCLVNCRHIV